jgi:hypothetical protein
MRDQDARLVEASLRASADHVAGRVQPHDGLLCPRVWQALKGLVPADSTEQLGNTPDEWTEPALLGEVGQRLREIGKAPPPRIEPAAVVLVLAAGL